MNNFIGFLNCMTYLFVHFELHIDWLMLSLLSTSILRFLSADLLSSHLSPSLCPYLALRCARCSTRHFPLSSFMLLMFTQCPSLPRSLCDASHPSRESTASPGLVSSMIDVFHSCIQKTDKNVEQEWS